MTLVVKNPINGQWEAVTKMMRDGTGWRPTTGHPRDVSFRPSTGPLRNILGGAMNVSGTWTTTNADPGKATITRHSVLANVSRPSFVWRFRKQLLGTVPATAGTFRARIKTSSIPWTDLTFSSALTATAPLTNTDVTSDPLSVNLYAGEDIYMLVWLHADGSPGPATGSQTQNVPSYDQGSLTGDWVTATTGVFPTVKGGTLRPSGLIAPSSKPSWVLGGDSIISISDNTFVDGALRRLGHATTKCSMGGEAFLHFPGRWADRYAGAMAYADTVLCQLGVNDLGSPIATVQANALLLWNQFRTAGATRLVQTVTTPAAATSTDSYATLANQTVGANNGTRITWNTWLRDGAPILNGAAVATGSSATGTVRTGATGHPVTLIVDPTTVVESSMNSGKWRVDAGADIAGDGTHPGQTAHRLMEDKLYTDLVAAGY